MAIKSDEIYDIMAKLISINERLYGNRDAYDKDVFDTIAGNIDTAYGAMSGTVMLIRRNE